MVATRPDLNVGCKVFFVKYGTVTLNTKELEKPTDTSFIYKFDFCNLIQHTEITSFLNKQQ